MINSMESVPDVTEDDMSFPWEYAPMMLLHHDHPYVRQFEKSCYIIKCNWGGKTSYEVRYRDFSSMRQDPECDTLEKAEKLRRKLIDNARKVYCWPEEFDDFNAFWFDASSVATIAPDLTKIAGSS